MTDTQNSYPNSKRTVRQNSNNPHDDEIDLGRLFATLLDYKWWVVGATAAAAALGLAYGVLSTPVYQSDALVQLEKKGATMPGLAELGDMFVEDSSAATEIEIVTSRMVLGTVVQQQRLDISVQPKRFPIIGGYLARRHGDKVPDPANVFDSYAWGGEILEFGELDLPRQLLNRELTFVAGTANGGQSYELYLDDERVFSGNVGETLTADTPYGQATVRVAELRANPNTEFKVTQRDTRGAVRSLRNNLSVSERGRQTGILDLRYSGTDPERNTRVLNAISQEYLLQNIRRNAAEIERSQEFLEEQLPRVQAELQEAEDRLNEFRLQSDSIDIQFDTQRVLNQLVELEKQLNELAIRETELSRLYTRNHPNYQSLIEQRERLEREREELRGEIQDLPEAQQQVLRLNRDVEVSQQVYLQLLNRNQELNILRAGTVGNVRIIDQADNTGQIAPRRALILALSIVLGGMVGVGIAFVLAMTRRGIETPGELEDQGIPVYASIPLSEKQLKMEEQVLRGRKGKKKHRRQLQKGNTLLLARDNPEDLAVEALRGLRTSLHFAMLESSNKVVMISGPSPEVGKTFITANLGVVLAQAGMKVLLVDGDLRRGFMHVSMGMENTNGFSDLLSERCTREQAIQQTPEANLDFVPRGTTPPNPSELLMHRNCQEFLDWANSEYDIVLIDTPPILAVTDAAIIGRYAGTNLLVARFMKSQAKEVDYTYERFEKAGIEIKGVILNGIERTARSQYGYGSYGYYTYGYESRES